MGTEAEATDLNRDPITDEPGAHPVGTGVGATAGAMAGAAAGSFAGPVGAAVGLVAGAVAGGLGGKATAEGINPTAEASYWRDSYTRESYYESAYGFNDYGPAYEYGWSSRAAYPGAFEQSEAALAGDWEMRRGGSRLSWDQARHATRAAWNRVGGTEASASGGNDSVVETLNDLLETSRDGELGFRECAESAKSPELRTLLQQRAQTCVTAVQQLEEQIRRLGGEPQSRGSIAGAMHRGWVATREMLGGMSDEAMLSECERGEDSAVAAFRKALKRDLPADVRAVIERMAQGTQRNHDQIKSLRDEAKAK